MEEDIPLKGRKSYFNQMYAIMHIHVANRLEKFQREYLWEGAGDTSKYHLVNWRVIWVFTSWGTFNQPLLGTWPWRVGMEKARLWRNKEDGAS